MRCSCFAHYLYGVDAGASNLGGCRIVSTGCSGLAMSKSNGPAWKRHRPACFVRKSWAKLSSSCLLPKAQVKWWPLRAECLPHCEKPMWSIWQPCRINQPRKKPKRNGNRIKARHIIPELSCLLQKKWQQDDLYATNAIKTWMSQILLVCSLFLWILDNERIGYLAVPWS